jgi:nitroreductase
MDAIQLLLERVSSPRLIEPAPSHEQQHIIFSAALRAPDHGQLRPWQFLVVEGEARKKLGDIFAQIAKTEDATISDEECARTKNSPMRSPLLVVVVAKITDSPKVPETEQIISAGIAAYAMLLAADALGFGGVWRTGAMAYHKEVKKALGIKPNDHIVGYLYIGTPERERKKRETLLVEDYFKNWGKPS